MKEWFRTGTPWVWLCGGAVALCLILVVGLISVISVRALVHFWPAELVEYEYIDQSGNTVKSLGALQDSEIIPSVQLAHDPLTPTDQEFVTRYLVKVGNREVSGADFKWIEEFKIKNTSVPKDAMVLERTEWGNFNGFLLDVNKNGQAVGGEDKWQVLQSALAEVTDIRYQIKNIEKGDIGKINYEVERLRLKQRKLEIEEELTPEKLAEIDEERAALNEEYLGYMATLQTLYEQVKVYSIDVRTANGFTKSISLDTVVRAEQPNNLSLLGKVGVYFDKMHEFVFDDPREANTEGGVFPAIFGTVMMVMLMSVIVTPFGVVAAIYLHEYAKQGFITRLIRISVINLAGVPSIVFGVFGLGFFVYFLGGNIDALFYPEAYPAPTFGTPGLMWASITLALLTVPVVIVATEEGLSRIPRAVREGSLALGATKAETLMRIVIPMTSPAIMTGLILAVARAAGEVAPLMLVGVVKLAPSLPLDGNFPFLHLERKFMHLGFHIYDVGFQSPNVEAARPLVYATAFLLILIIIALNLAAIRIRNQLREKYRALES